MQLDLGGDFLCISEEELGWLGGIIDGEGSISVQITKDKRSRNLYGLRPFIKVANTNQTCIDHLQSLLHKLNIHFHYYYKKSKKEQHKDAWELTISKTEQILQLAQILPVFGKRKKIEQLKELCLIALWRRRGFFGNDGTPGFPKATQLEWQLAHCLRKNTNNKAKTHLHLHKQFTSICDIHLGWIAGILDGEGSIFISHQRRLNKPDNLCTHVDMMNTLPELISMYCAILSALKIKYKVFTKPAKCEQWSKAWKVAIWKQSDIRRLLYIVAPLLQVKRKQAALLLAFCSPSQPRRFGLKGTGFTENDYYIAGELKNLNKRGK